MTSQSSYLSEPLSHSEFAKWVHEVCNRLYDSPYLQSHPLCNYLVDNATTDPIQRSQALRRIVLAAIGALRPQAGTPAQSPDWRYYRILEQRYIEGFSPVEVMQQLGVSKSQFYRDQAHSFTLLVEQLWQERQPPIEDNASSRRIDDVSESSGDEISGAPNPADDLFYAADWKLIHLAELLDELQPVLGPLAQIHGVHFQSLNLYDLPPIQADRIMLRQTLINVLTYALTSAQAPAVILAPYLDAESVGLVVDYLPRLAAAPDDIAQDSAARLAPAAQFMTVMGGTLTVQAVTDSVTEAAVTAAANSAAARCRIVLSWPHNRDKVLLVIDDNQGLVTLFQRYLVNEPWQIVAAQSGTEAFALLARITPALILLDIMLPQQDGWELLVQLKRHPTTAQVPVLICSVVHEAQLAASLGAAGYITKPVTQESLIHALRPWR